MKAVLLHGPGISNSRKKLIDLKQKFDLNDVVTFEEGASSADILASLQTVSMFSQDRLIIVENPSDDLFLNFSPLTSHLSLLLWYDHEIDPKNWPGFEVYFFPEEKEASMFPLLDSLGNRDKKAYVELEKRNRTSPNDTQYIFTMVFYLLRSFNYLPAKSPEFVRQKIARQKRNFTNKQIIDLYKLILESDFKIKKGLIEPAQAEFLMVSGFFNTL